MKTDQNPSFWQGLNVCFKFSNSFYFFLAHKNTNAQAILNLFRDHDITGYGKSVPFTVHF